MRKILVIIMCVCICVILSCAVIMILTREKEELNRPFHDAIVVLSREPSTPDRTVWPGETSDDPVLALHRATPYVEYKGRTPTSISGAKYERDEEQHFKYEIVREGYTARIVEYTGDRQRFAIPEKVNGKAVTAIGPDLLRQPGSNGEPVYYSVEIPDSVTDLDLTQLITSEWLKEIIVSPDHPTLCVIDGALIRKTDGQLLFYPHTSNAIFWTIPDEVRSIGDYAFFHAVNLREIVIPDSVTIPGANPFWMCSSLASVRVSPDHPSLEVDGDFLISKEDRRLITCLNKSRGESYVIPDGVREIGDFAFTHCEVLQSVTFPAGLDRIGKKAFENCGFLQEINTDARHIDSQAFKDCVNLRTVRLTGAGTIGDRAFDSCLRMSEVTLPEGLTGIGYAAFNGCRGLESVEIPDTVTEMGNGVFNGCESLVSARISGGMAELSSGTFCNCPALASVSLPEGLKTIGYDAFYKCAGLQSLKLPESLVSIKQDAFFNTGIRYLEIPAGVTEIEKTAHYGNSDSLWPILVVVEGSYAEQFCREKGIEYLTGIPEQDEENASKQ